MTPELESALLPIGWLEVKRRLPLLVPHFHERLTPTGDRLTANATLAKAERVSHVERCQAILNAVDSLARLPRNWREAINVAACPHEERDDGIPDRVQTAIDALEDLAPGLLALHDLVNFESSATGSNGGRPTNGAAYAVALAVADIHVLGLGKPIGYGGDGEKTKRPTPYGIAVKATFDALGIGAGTKGPCQAARKKMREGRQERLLAIRNFSVLPSLLGL